MFTIEWTLIVVYIVVNLFSGWFELPVVFALRPIAFLVIFALLSFILPLHRSFIERLIYISIGMLLPIAAIALGVDLELFLYLYIAKSCFLLSRKQAIFSAVFFGAIGVVSYYWTLPYNFQMLAQLGIDSRQPIQLTFSYLEGYLGGSAFVILAIFAILAEQKSRHRAEHLAQQVEQLAADLERARIARDLHDYTQKGFGLKGIAERVQLLGGKLAIESAMERGTKIQIILPQTL